MPFDDLSRKLDAHTWEQGVGVTQGPQQSEQGSQGGRA